MSAMRCGARQGKAMQCNADVGGRGGCRDRTTGVVTEKEAETGRELRDWDSSRFSALLLGRMGIGCTVSRFRSTIFSGETTEGSTHRSGADRVRGGGPLSSWRASQASNPHIQRREQHWVHARLFWNRFARWSGASIGSGLSSQGSRGSSTDTLSPRPRTTASSSTSTKLAPFQLSLSRQCKTPHNRFRRPKHIIRQTSSKDSSAVKARQVS